MTNKVNLFVDDDSLRQEVTLYNDLYIETVDMVAWAARLENDAWPKDAQGYNISFTNKDDTGFHLELNQEGMEELYRVIRDALCLPAND